MEENLDVFFADFGVDVVGPSPAAGKGILDQPDHVFGDDMRVASTEYLLTVKTSDFPSLKFGDEVTIGTDTYSVREPLKSDDGALTKVLLSKEAP